MNENSYYHSAEQFEFDEMARMYCPKPVDYLESISLGLGEYPQVTIRSQIYYQLLLPFRHWFTKGYEVVGVIHSP